MGSRDGAAEVDLGPEPDEEENPLVGYRAALVRDWPEPALRPEADAPFPTDGARPPSMPPRPAAWGRPVLVDLLDDEGRRAYEAAAAERRSLAAHLREREAAEGGGPSSARPPRCRRAA